MSGVDELLGRLETSAVRYEIGRGGIPELTPQDIAAALGMCEDRFAATIYHAAFGGTLDWPEVDRMIASAQFAEWRSRADRMVTAQLVKVQAKYEPKQHRADRLKYADMLLSGARAAMWPQLVEEVYANMRKALIAEMRSSRTCDSCKGRATVIVENVVVKCPSCLGTGRVSVSDRQRSMMLKIPHSTYSRVWKPVYDWMYRMLMEAADRGRQQFNDALGRLER